jgi:excisionase family DNA binding protein
MSKQEVIEYLERSKRSIETYVKSGRLPAKYAPGPNGKTLVFERAAVEEFKRRMLEVWDPTIDPEAAQPVPRSAPAAVARVAPAGDVQTVAATIAAVLREAMQPAPAVKPWLTLSEASDYSGLSESYLVRAARDGSIRAINLAKNGGRAFWRFNRDALGK